MNEWTLSAASYDSVNQDAKWKPWLVKTYIALSDEARARELERYLKSSSGRAFAEKRL